MALPTDVQTVHHVGLGGYGFFVEGYQKEIQKEKTGSGGAEFGGNTDLIGQAPSLNRWTQDDFIGGMFAYSWFKDDAMFASCLGMMPSQQSRSLISCPPMFQKKTGLSSSNIPKSMFMVGGSIYVCYPDILYRYRIDTNALTSYTLPGSDVFTFAEYDSQDQKIWTGNHVSGSVPLIRRINTDLTDPSVDNVLLGPPSTDGWSFINGTIFNQFIVTQFGRRLFIGTPPKDSEAAINGKIKWRDVTRLPGRWRDSLPYNNTLYILVNDGSFKTSIYAFDGTDATAICTFPFNFYGKTMIEYAGRIFVGGTGTDVNGGEHYAELYEVTGASVRLVRTFSPETRNAFLGGAAGEWPTSFDDLTVHEGLLWMSQKGKSMVAYDITSDAFFGAAQILENTSLDFVKMVSGRGRIWCLGNDDAIWRIRQPADGSGGWNPTFVSSDLTYEIATKKNWSEIVVMSRYGQVTSIEYSTNSGGTWTALTGLTIESSGQVHFATKSLSALTPSKIIRFRIKLSSTGDAGQAETYHRELVAFTVSFGMTSATQKKAWGMTIVGAEQIETRTAEFQEDTVQAYDVSEVRDQLWAWADSGSTITLRDLNGSSYSVKVEGFRETQPVVAPIATGETIQNEAMYSLSLLEV